MSCILSLYFYYFKTGGLRKVTSDVVEKMLILGINVNTNKKMCPACRIEMNKRINHYSSEELSDELEDLDLKHVKSKERLNSTLDAMELSPFKTHAIAAHSVLSHGEKKLRQSKSSFITKQNELQKHLAESLEVQPDDL